MSTNHANAQYYFDRDVACVKRYFERRFKYVSDESGPFFADAIRGASTERRLDIEVEASGFSKKMGKDLDRFIEATNTDAVEADALIDQTREDEGEEDEGEDGVDEEGDDERDEDEEGVGGDDAEFDDAGLADEMGALSADDPTAFKPFDPSAFGLEPLDLPQDNDVVTEKVRSKKKATGWAI